MDKEILSTTHGLNWTSQQNPEIEMGLYQQRCCQFQLKEAEKVGQGEGRLSDFLDFIGDDHRTLWL